MNSRAIVAGALLRLTACGDTPATYVVLDNRYPAASGAVLYAACWQAACLPSPVLPGQSSWPLPTVAASSNTAYAVIAQGWDPSSGATPRSVVVLQSRSGFAVHLDNTLHIAVDDSTFEGNCAAGSRLTQDQADFVTQRIFPSDFASLAYDAATCTAAATGDGGGP